MAKTRVTTLEKNPEMGEFAEELRGKDFSYRDIAKQIKKKFDYSLSHQAVKNYFDNKGHLTQKMVQSNEELKENVYDQVMDTVDEMKRLNKVIWDIIDDMREEGKAPVSAINSAIKLVKLQRKLAGDLLPIKKQENTTNILNYTDMAVSINKRLKDLEKQGYIVIKKPLPGTDEEEDDE